MKVAGGRVNLNLLTRSVNWFVFCMRINVLLVSYRSALRACGPHTRDYWVARCLREMFMCPVEKKLSIRLLLFETFLRLPNLNTGRCSTA